MDSASILTPACDDITNKRCKQSRHRKHKLKVEENVGQRDVYSKLDTHFCKS